MEFPRSLVELELMHHFSFHTSSTFAFSTERFRAWQVSLPHLAFECRFVMTAVLAISALCLCRDKLGRVPKPATILTNPYDPHDHVPGLLSAEDCFEVANYYYQQTIKELRFEIKPGANDVRRAEFSLAASYILAMYALAYRGIGNQLHAETRNDGLSMEWIFFGRGINSIKQQRLVFAARHYLMRFKTLTPCRFDVVLIQGGLGAGGEPTIEWLRSAFDAF